MARTIVVLVMLAAASAPAVGLEDTGLGPIEIAPLGPSLVFRDTPAFLFSPPQAVGGMRFNAAVNWLNYWLFNIESEVPYASGQDPDTFPFEYGTFLIDMEVLSLTPRVEWQASRRLRMDASLQVFAIGGGALDAFIEGFHDAFSIDNHRRDEWERDRVSLLYIQRDGTRVALDEGDLEGGHWGNAAVGATVSLWEGRTASSVRAVVKAPTASLEYFGSNGWDGTLQWNWAWCSGRVCGYHGVGFTRHGSGGDGEVELKTRRLSLMSALETRISPRTSALLQLMWADPYADYPEIDEPVFEMTLGLKKRLRNSVLEIGFIENLLFYDNSPDIGFHIALTWPAP